MGITLELEREGNMFMMELWLEEWGCMWFSPSIFWAAACWTAGGLSAAPGAKITTSVSARMALASSTVSISLVAGPTWVLLPVCARTCFFRLSSVGNDFAHRSQFFLVFSSIGARAL